MPRRRIDCIDCHNAAGHPFGNPADLVDDAIQEGRIDRSLPSIKARSDAIIQKAAGINGPEAERAAKFAALIAAAAPQGEHKPKVKEAEQKFAAEMQRILLLTSFAAKDITWKTFPNNVGHKDFPGCFRCHDGKHMNAKGEAIRLQCTLCHALPQVVAENGVRSVPSTVSPDLTPPSSHEEPNWMHDHRTQVDSSCGALPRQDPVGRGRRQLLLEPGLPRAQMAGDEPRCRGGCAGRCRQTGSTGQAGGAGQVRGNRSRPRVRARSTWPRIDKAVRSIGGRGRLRRSTRTDC